MEALTTMIRLQSWKERGAQKKPQAPVSYFVFGEVWERRTVIKGIAAWTTGLAIVVAGWWGSKYLSSEVMSGLLYVVAALGYAAFLWLFWMLASYSLSQE